MIVGNKKKECGHLRCGATCRLGKKPKKIYKLKRTPLKKKFYQIKVSKRPNKVSAKRKVENAEYKILREKFLKEHPMCECGREGCDRKAVEIHHSKGRVGKNFLDVSTWKAVARVCHRWAEENPIEAKNLGLSESRLKSSKKTNGEISESTN